MNKTQMIPDAPYLEVAPSLTSEGSSGRDRIEHNTREGMLERKSR
jgi:hypothetical protein